MRAKAGCAGAVREPEHGLQELQPPARTGRSGANARAGAVPHAPTWRADWIASPDSTIVRVHQHGATLPGDTGARSNDKTFGREPPDQTIGRYRGGLTTKNDLDRDGKGRALACLLTPGQVVVTSMLADTLREIHVKGRLGGRRTRPDRVVPDIGYASKAHRVWLCEHRIASMIPERVDHAAHRRRLPGRPIEFGTVQWKRYKRHDVVENCFNRLEQ